MRVLQCGSGVGVGVCMVADGGRAGKGRAAEATVSCLGKAGNGEGKLSCVCMGRNKLGGALQFTMVHTARATASILPLAAPHPLAAHCTTPYSCTPTSTKTFRSSAAAAPLPVDVFPPQVLPGAASPRRQGHRTVHLTARHSHRHRRHRRHYHHQQQQGPATAAARPCWRWHRARRRHHRRGTGAPGDGWLCRRR